MADKKSNPSQIAQAVLDEENQAIKVTVVGSGGGTGADVNLIQVNGNNVAAGAGLVTAGTQRVVLASNQPTIPVDIQDTEIAISIDKDEDSVTIYAPDNNTTPIPVDILDFPAPLDVVGEGIAAEALRVHLSDESLTALGSPTVNVTITDVDVTSVPAPLNVTGPGVASAALRVQLADESLAALENISVTVTNTALEITNDAGNPIPVSGTVNANTGLLQPLTDAQLRATPVPVSATNLDVRDLAFASDKVDVSGSSVSATVSGSVTVSATDLDIRNLTATDVVTVTGGAGQTADVKVTLDGEAIALPVGAATLAEQQTQSTELVAIKNAIDDLEVSVSAPKDILGVGISGTRNNQVEVSFDSAPGVSLVTETFAGGGSVSITAGHSIYSTGTATTASAQVVTVQKVVYRPAHEIYAYFTAAFTAGVANSYQRIGLFDVNNGFFVGFEGTTFGITKRTSTVDTFTARTSFSDDLLNGNPASRFTRNGVPEAINLGFSNLFRVRFAWLGSASVIFEVFTPDGDWIPFHTLKVPNSQYNPSIANPDLPISLQVAKTAADATNISIATACWAGGTTSDYVKISDTLTQNTLASLTRSIITGETTGGGGGFVNVKVDPSGALTVSATQDGTWNINDITGTVSLPTGASTLAAQNTGNASLSSIDGKLNSLGQKAMAASVPVVIASDQSAVPASQSGTWNINDITGTVSLPTGAATSAKQPALGTAGTPSADVITVQGAAAMTALIVDGSAVTQPVSGTVTVTQATAANLNATVTGTVAATQSGTWNINDVTGTVSLPTGASTLAAQNTGNASLSSIDTKTPALGQALMVGSSPVVLASNHTPILVYTQQLQTYAAGITNLNGTGALLATNPTDIATITGVAGKVVRVRKIHMSGIATNSAQIDVFLIKRSTANTGGTSVTLTNVPYDSLNVAAGATVRYYGAAAAPTNPTLGTAVGTISQSMLYLSPPTSSGTNPTTGNNSIEIDFIDGTLQPLTLRGVNEVLAINLNGITVPGGTNLEIDFVWTEE